MREGEGTSKKEMLLREEEESASTKVTKGLAVIGG